MLFDKFISMQKCLIPLLLICLISGTTKAQYISKLKADTVIVTGASGTGELIIENNTRNIPGYLFNKGNGRTEFRQLTGSGGWSLPGVSGLSGSSFIGTQDGTKLIFKTNSMQHASFDNSGVFTIGPEGTASFPKFRMFLNGDFLMNAPDLNYTAADGNNVGMRFNNRLGYLELVGTKNIIDTAVADTIWDGTKTSGIFINNGVPNHILGPVKNSIVLAQGVRLPANSAIYFSLLVGGNSSHAERVRHSIIVGDSIHTQKELNNTFMQGFGHHLEAIDLHSTWSGIGHRNLRYTFGNFTGGMYNSVGSAAQLTAGNRLHNRSFAGTAIGNSNVDFATLPYNGWDSINTLSIQPGYLLFSAGNSQQKAGESTSNAMTVLYNGRTQINTTGFTNALSEQDVRPKAALEIVSKNSGVLLPKLSTTSRDSIDAGDLHKGLLLFNTTSNRFEFYNGSAWIGIGEGASGGIQSLKDSSVVNWDLSKGTVMSVKLSDNRSLSISNIIAGAKGKLIIRQDSTGRRTLTLPANSIVNNVFNGTVGLTPMAGSIDIASFEYDGSFYYWTIEKGFTSSPRTARFNFNASPQFVPGWNDVSGNPHQAIRTATDWTTGIGISSIATNKWSASGNITSHNTLGESAGNPTFAFEQKIGASYWFTATVTYSTSTDCNIEINGLQSGASYNIEILSSRAAFGISQPTHLMRLVCVDNSGESFVNDFNVKNNTANLVTFNNKKPNGSGKILLFIGKRNPADANHPFGYINGIRVTKL